MLAKGQISAVRWATTANPSHRAAKRAVLRPAKSSINAMPSPVAHLGSGGKVALCGFPPDLATGGIFVFGASSLGGCPGAEPDGAIGEIGARFRGRGDLLAPSLVRFRGGPSPPGVVRVGMGGCLEADEVSFFRFFLWRRSSEVPSEGEETRFREAGEGLSQTSNVVPVWSQRLCLLSQVRHRLLSSILTTMSHLCLRLQFLALHPTEPWN